MNHDHSMYLSESDEKCLDAIKTDSEDLSAVVKVKKHKRKRK